MSKINSTVEIRALTPGDLKSIHEIAVQSFEKPWAEADFRYFILSKDGWHRGAFQQGQLIGYFLALSLAGHEMDIVSLATLPSSRRQGIAKRLVQEAVNQKSFRRLILEVRKDNLAAIRLYAGLGFIVFGERKKYYEGKWDAICMHLIKETLPS